MAETFIMDFRYHDTLSIILRKRFDRQYLSSSEQSLQLAAPNEKIRYTERGPGNKNTGIRCLNLLVALNMIAWSVVILVGHKVYFFQGVDKELRTRSIVSIAWHAISEAAKITLEFIMHLILTVASINLYGMSMVSLWIVACVTDMLAKVQERGDNLSHGIVRGRRIQTTQLLGQVRDVLIVLSRVLNVDFTAIYIHDYTMTLGLLGIVLANARSGSLALVGFFGFQVLLMILRMFSFRLSYHLLSEEIERIRDKSHRQLTGKRCSSRVEAKTNCQLADELVQVMKSIPTDWFRHDIKALMSQILALFTFAVSLQQIALARLKG